MNRIERPMRARDGHISPLRLSLYADGETPREELAEIEAHLNACPICSARLDALRSVSAKLAALPRTAPSAGVFDKVLAGARRVDNASNVVARERLGRMRGNGPRLREAPLPDMDAPASPTPPSRRSYWRGPLTSALPTIAALLLIALTAGLLMRSPFINMLPFTSTAPTATIPPGDTLNATKSAIASETRHLSFKPVQLTYLPAEARLESVALTTLAPGITALDISWAIGSGPLRGLRLREQSASGAPTNGYNSAAAQTAGLAWQVDQSPPWRAMTRVAQAGWSGVEQTYGDAWLQLQALPAPGASAIDLATELRLTSLSMDAHYIALPVAIGGPPNQSPQRAIASVTVSGQTWNWDVTLSGDKRSRNSTITNPSGSVDVTEITSVTGAGVRLDMKNKVYQTFNGPTLYNPTPLGVTEIAYTVSTYLRTGELWNLGVRTITPPGGHSMSVYDLYRVDTTLPEHVYAAVTTGAVVAIKVDASSPFSPGGPGSAQPYVSTTACAPYTVMYTWIIFEPAAPSASLFTPTPLPGFKSGAVSLPFTCGG